MILPSMQPAIGQATAMWHTAGIPPYIVCLISACTVFIYNVSHSIYVYYYIVYICTSLYSVCICYIYTTHVYIHTHSIYHIYVYIKQHVCVYQSFIQGCWFHKGRDFFINCNNSSHKHSWLIAGTQWYMEDCIGKKEFFLFLGDALGLLSRSACCW